MSLSMIYNIFRLSFGIISSHTLNFIITITASSLTICAPNLTVKDFSSFTWDGSDMLAGESLLMNFALHQQTVSRFLHNWVVEENVEKS